MNNLQHIVKDSTRYAMHVAVELCEQGDFDSVREALAWLMEERDGACDWIAEAEWLWKCSNCKRPFHADHARKYKHCPECGFKCSGKVMEAVER